MSVKVVNKSFKMDSNTANAFSKLVAKAGVSQSEVIRHLIAQADAKEVVSDITKTSPKNNEPLYINMSDGGVIPKNKGMGLGTGLVISAGAGLAGYYITKEILKTNKKEEDFATQYLVGICAGLGVFGLLAAVFGKK
jgi:hypothetical protein